MPASLQHCRSARWGSPGKKGGSLTTCQHPRTCCPVHSPLLHPLVDAPPEALVDEKGESSGQPTVICRLCRPTVLASTAYINAPEARQPLLAGCDREFSGKMRKERVPLRRVHQVGRVEARLLESNGYHHASCCYSLEICAIIFYALTKISARINDVEN
eukprot:334762-Pelagomonas_calceolata.AAC.2